MRQPYGDRSLGSDRDRPANFSRIWSYNFLDCHREMSYILIIGRQEETEMTEQTSRKLRQDLTPAQREQAERIAT